MFPHVVLAQPRQFDQQPFHSSFNSLPNSPHAITPRKLPQYGVDNHSNRVLPQLPQQYAHPLQRNNSYPSHGSQKGTDAEQPHGSEHMLRRKTPNGTLAAGYDGTPVNWASEPHAMKHILLPAAEVCGNSNLRSSYSKEHGQQLPLRQHPVSPGWHSISDTRPSRTPHYNDGGLLGYHGYLPGGNWAPAQHCSQGVDSVLNQGPVQQTHMYFLSNGQPVPAILQPTYQPCLGPTASNDIGPFGPYWPDGAFVPYRPAALRDPRYHPEHEGSTWCAAGGYSQIPVRSEDWPKSIGGSSNRNTGANEGSSYLSNPTKPSCISRPTYKASGNQFFPQGPYPDYTHASQAFPSRVNAPQTRRPGPEHYHCPSSAGNEDSQRSQNTFCQLGTPNDYNILEFEQPSNSTLDIGSYDAQFREKVSSWAHCVYIDLLASLHQSQKNNPRSASGQHPNHRLNIYPRPPRQPRSHISTSHSSQLHPLYHQQSQRYPQEEHSSKRLKHYEGHVNASLDGRAFQHACLPWAPNGVQFHDSDYKHRAARQHQHKTPPYMAGESTKHFSSKDSHRVHTLRRTSGAILSPIISQHQQSTSPRTNSLAALELLTKLCDDSAWKWIDGMLLGGCLAYGLGDYNKALRWYSKILSIDSNHVEATSNLAATLLSLNRREEAEQYWLRSVKLRPSYFEAVEHLIGLLCGDHRGKEAVNIIEFVEREIKLGVPSDPSKTNGYISEVTNVASQSSSVPTSKSYDKAGFDYEGEDEGSSKGPRDTGLVDQPGFGSSGYAIPGSENGRILALVHAKGNMLYALGDNVAAAKAFEDAVLIGAGKRMHGIEGLIKQISRVVLTDIPRASVLDEAETSTNDPVLLLPERALQTSKLVFPSHGELPGLKYVPHGMARKAAISTTSNSLLSLAKIFQDGMSSSVASAGGPKANPGVRDILALYYLSLALQPSPSTANNVGILLASVQQSATAKPKAVSNNAHLTAIPGVVPGSGIALALAYYNYGLNLDPRHAHLYTNLGSLLKDIGQLTAAIKMYERAVAWDGKFDIALANLANAVKDQGKISDAIVYYRRAVNASPEFAEAVCGLANALNSVCDWTDRGGVVQDDGKRDRWHVDAQGMLLDAQAAGVVSTGWMKRVVDIVEKQLTDGENWGKGVLRGDVINAMQRYIGVAQSTGNGQLGIQDQFDVVLNTWTQQRWEGARVVRLVERIIKRIGWQWYQDKFVRNKHRESSYYKRPQLPSALSVPSAPTVLPFHTFTCPLSAKQIRRISQRNGLRISCSTLRAPWLPDTVYSPPKPPNPCLKVGYVSSDFNNHPLAHLMQSVFGFHDGKRVRAFCYATTASDNSVHRQHIEREAPVFHDASTWSTDRLVRRIVQDGIHILVNLNGYTRGARNEVFAARPAPIQMSFMGFAGTLGAEWCDYLLADDTAVPPETLRPFRQNVNIQDQASDRNNGEQDNWVYSENVIFTKDTFFCCDHKQSAPGAEGEPLSWEDEQRTRWDMRKELFPNLEDDAIVFANFNQLYKIEPSTFRVWLRILTNLPRAILWLLRFPELGESNLKQTALQWAGAEVASRIIFTDVAPKHQHISRARVCDLFLDTPECNAHTTAADVLWSGTPLLTLPRYKYKMCSRMAASILKGALPKSDEGNRAAEDLIVATDEEYAERATMLGIGLVYSRDPAQQGKATGRLMELRRLLYDSRWTSALFDTRRWVRDLEAAYAEAWRKWTVGEGGDIWL
ncbi:MAG: hypothetical protein M1812_000068 [Candelaria pacifica]|nr:MAG: hypothetical protein M1812_000068 [Candelaria pacifica]